MNIPPLLADQTPPPLPADANPKPNSRREWLANLLSVCLGWFLLDGVASIINAGLIYFCGVQFFSLLSGLIAAIGLLMVLALYLLMGLTPMVPKRLFLPLPLFTLAATLAFFPIAIYDYAQLPVAALVMGAVQTALGLLILFWAKVGHSRNARHWPLVPVARLNPHGFSALNLAGFLALNIGVVLPAIVAYLFFCGTLAVNHFSGGFMSLHPNGFTVQVRKYARADGKTIELFPMSHVAEEAFYRQVTRAFPTNSIILMEGVTDSQNLLTNKITYQRMARSLGLAEQHDAFKPGLAKLIRADVDVNQFSPSTLEMLNVIMLIQGRGINAQDLAAVSRLNPTPETLAQLWDDLLRKRNQHLLEEIQAHLKTSDNIMVPWGVAHMPGVSLGIQTNGFHFTGKEDFMVIRFFRSAKSRSEN